MYTLGLTGGADAVYSSIYNFDNDFLHDSAAVLLYDNQVIAAIEEERLNRIKHTNKFASSALRFCLDTAGIALSDVDSIAVYGTANGIEKCIKRWQYGNADIQLPSSAAIAYQQLLQRELGEQVPEQKIHFVHHHVSHAAASYYMSGFDSALVLTIDGEGDEVSTTVMSAYGKQFEVLAEKPTAESLGLFYMDVIGFLGYGIFDEYKVMGLAPYGVGERYRSLFQRFYTLLPGGDYALHRDAIADLHEVLVPRRSGESFGQVHMDIAAALQEALEDIVFHVLRHYRETTGHRRLVISGGVGQNSSMNGKILRSGLFDQVFAPSFAGDSGCALGAAMQVAHAAKPALSLCRIEHAYWGSHVGDLGVTARELHPWRDFLHIEAMEDTSEQVAELIAGGAVVGWVQERSEFGPRALGNRSIVADPRVAEHKEVINAMIKKREAYRPFAPSVQEEHVADFFEVGGHAGAFPFMSFVLPVKEGKRALLPAITHVDGTARLQTVSKRHNKKFWLLIDAFRKRTGVAMLLNTSFNNNAEPIVDSATDAVVCYLTSGLDYLVVGDFLISKKPWGRQELESLAVALPKAARAVLEYGYVDEERRAEQAYLVWNYDDSRRSPIPLGWYRILGGADGKTSLRGLMDELQMSRDERDEVVRVLPDLWAERAVLLHPVKAG